MTLLVRNRPFRLLFSATAVSNLGDGVAALAFPWIATLLTRDPLLIALVTAATRLPWFLFVIPAGLITDRNDRRRLIVQADLLRLLLSFGVIALALRIPDSAAGGQPGGIAILCGLAFLIGCAEVIRDNAAQTLLPALVDKPDLEQANGQLWSVEQITGSFIGPPLAGALIAFAVPAPFALNAICFGLAAWCVWLMALPPRIRPVRRALLDEFSEAARWFWGHTAILRLAIVLGLINALSTMVLTMLVLISQEVLGLNAAGYGLLLTAGAAGGVVGGVWGPRLVARLGGQRVVILALWVFPLPMLVLGLTASPWIAAAALFVESLAALLWNIVTVSWRQRLIPDDLLGRVNSLYRFFGWGMVPFGAVLGGWIVSLAEPGLGRAAALSLPYFIGFAGACALAVYGTRHLRL